MYWHMRLSSSILQLHLAGPCSKDLRAQWAPVAAEAPNNQNLAGHLPEVFMEVRL